MHRQYWHSITDHRNQMGHHYNRKNLYEMCVSLWAQKEEMKTLQCAGREDIQDLSLLVVRMGTGASCLCAMH